MPPAPDAGVLREWLRPPGQAAVPSADELPEPRWLPYVPGGAAVAQWTGPAAPQRRRALRAIALANRGTDRAAVVLDAESVLRSPGPLDLLSWWCAVFALVYVGDTEAAERHCALRAHDPDESQPEFARALHARLCWLRGAPGKAAELLRGLLERTQRPLLRELLVAWSVTASADAGDLDGASGLLVDHACDPAVYRCRDKAELFAAIGHLELATGRHDGARSDFLECGRLLTTAGVHNPAVLPWRSRAALCAEAAGRHRLATVLAERELLLARRWSTPWSVGVAAHAHAVVVTRTPESAGQAADLLAGAAAAGDLLRARYDLAHFLSSAGRYGEAREVLRSAAELTGRGGYRGWAARVDAALHRLTQQAGDRLTPQERKIAGLARTGMSNPRIAEQQCLTLRTVEFHLSSVYRKLGISGRAELAVIPTGTPPPG